MSKYTMEIAKVGDKVIDRWFEDWGIGTVKKKLKTRLHIDFPLKNNSLTVFDTAHLQFLKKTS